MKKTELMNVIFFLVEVVILLYFTYMYIYVNIYRYI